MSGYQYTPFIIPLAASAAITVFTLWIAWHHRSEPVVPWFTATMVALLVWDLGYMLELTAATLHAKIVWADIEYVAIVTLPLLWLQVVLVYTGRGRLSRRAWVVLECLAALMLAIIILNPGHQFRGAPHLAHTGSLNALHPDYGLLYLVAWVPYMYGILLFASLLLTRGLFSAQKIYARQYAALLVATILPLAAGTLYAAGLSPWPEFNPAMAVITLSGVLMAYALFSCRLFSVAPLARDSVVEHLADGVIVVDERERLADFNPSAARALPELACGAIGRPLADVLAGRPEASRALLEVAREAVSRGWVLEPHRACELRVEAAPAGPDTPAARHYSVTATAVTDRAGALIGAALMLNDVTRRVELLDEAQRLASTDGLTGLLNRRRFIELADRELARAARSDSPVTLLLLDIDRLKLVNDTCGHAAGDSVLGSVADVCRRELRPFDVVGRLGGDEFGVLLPDADLDQGLQVAERLRREIGKLAGAVLQDAAGATVSIGACTAQAKGGDGIDALLDSADRALYRAKDDGRDRIAVAGRLEPRTTG